MDLGLGGRHVLVTGGSKGIGLACAAAFTAEGAIVAICSRDAENLAAARRLLPDVRVFEADCADAASAARMVARVEAEVGPLDILVSSAGAARRTPVEDLTPDHWRAAMDAKYFATVNVARPGAQVHGGPGRGVAVNVIGTGGKVASPIHLAGGAANAALMLATAGLGAAYARRGLRVVGVSPSLTDTTRVAEGPRGRCRGPRDRARGGARQDPRGAAARPHGQRRGGRRRRAVPGLRSRRLHHRHDPVGRRRPESHGRVGRSALTGRPLPP